MWSLVRFTIAAAREGLYASNDVGGGEAGRREAGKRHSSRRFGFHTPVFGEPFLFEWIEDFG
jgi:hypothetical protein